MFFYFYDEYKEKIYKGARRKLKGCEILMLIGVVFFGLFSMLSFALNWAPIVKTIGASSLILIGIVIWIYTDQNLKRNRDSLLRGHKENHIEPLCQQLRNYGLYSSDGIAWLIDCCQEKKKSNYNSTSALGGIFKTSFMGVVYPVITLALGLILKDGAPEEIIQFIVEWSAVFVIGVLVIIILQPIASFIAFPDKSIVDYLENDLKYIKTQL